MTEVPLPHNPRHAMPLRCGLPLAVSRIVCKGQNFEMEMSLDVNTDIYPVEDGDKFMLALASTLK